MTTKPNGGYAFPQHIAVDTATPEEAGASNIYGSDDFEGCAGMTLRDYAAIHFASAMIGTAAAPALTGMQGAESAVARAALNMADAFLAERDK